MEKKPSLTGTDQEIFSARREILIDGGPDAGLRRLLGEACVPSLPASRLPSRLAHMRDEAHPGDEKWRRKLRYLICLS